MSFRDRLTLTGAVRSDQNSAFGTDFQRVYYPKASISWVMSEESFFPQLGWLNYFRPRASFGASGVQPGPNDAARTYATNITNIAAADVGGLRSNLLGNAKLKPERSTEFETGLRRALPQQPREPRAHVLQQDVEGRAHRSDARAVGRHVEQHRQGEPRLREELRLRGADQLADPEPPHRRRGTSPSAARTTPTSSSRSARTRRARTFRRSSARRSRRSRATRSTATGSARSSGATRTATASSRRAKSRSATRTVFVGILAATARAVGHERLRAVQPPAAPNGARRPQERLQAC